MLNKGKVSLEKIKRMPFFRPDQLCMIAPVNYKIKPVGGIHENSKNLDF